MVAMEEYIKDIEKIVKALGIEKEPVGVKYTDEAPGVEIEEGSYTVCGGLLEAADGKIISGNFNVSVGDISARRIERWDPSIMTVPIPIERIAGVADAVDKSTAGTAETSSEFKEMTEKMRSRKV
jgi:uncharacterized protein (DUF169 family)